MLCNNNCVLICKKKWILNSPLTLFCPFSFVFILFLVRSLAASLAPHEAHFITIHALESHEFCREVVPVKALLGSVADPAGEQTEPAAHLTGVAGVWALELRKISNVSRI